jgi:hypothetical protein
LREIPGRICNPITFTEPRCDIFTEPVQEMEIQFAAVDSPIYRRLAARDLQGKRNDLAHDFGEERERGRLARVREVELQRIRRRNGKHLSGDFILFHGTWSPSRAGVVGTTRE